MIHGGCVDRLSAGDVFHWQTGHEREPYRYRVVSVTNDLVEVQDVNKPTMLYSIDRKGLKRRWLLKIEKAKK